MRVTKNDRSTLGVNPKIFSESLSVTNEKHVRRQQYERFITISLNRPLLL